MRAIACVDGEFAEIEQARVPVVDRGFLYGDAVFEALRTFGGVPDALELHLSRLARSCAIFGIELGDTLQSLEREVHQAIARIEGPEAYLRIMVSRGDWPEAFAPKGARAPRRVILARTLPAALEQRLSVIDVMSVVAPPSPLWAGAKPTAYINNLLAVARADAAGAQDALLLGAHGELLEGATSSVFLVQAGELLTPPVALGILPGITRDRVLACARRLGLVARERLLTIHDAYRASEVFLTSSVRGVAAVGQLDGRPVGQGAPGPITQQLFQAYRAEVSAGGGGG